MAEKGTLIEITIDNKIHLIGEGYTVYYYRFVNLRFCYIVIRLSGFGSE